MEGCRASSSRGLGVGVALGGGLGGGYGVFCSASTLFFVPCLSLLVPSFDHSVLDKVTSIAMEEVCITRVADKP